MGLLLLAVAISPFAGDPAILQQLSDIPAVSAPEIRGAAPARTLDFNGAAVPAYVFSSQYRVSDQLTAVIGKTRRTLDLALYMLNLPDVTEALLQAKARGVKLRLIVDHGHFHGTAGKARSKELQALVDAKVEIRTLRGSDAYGSMHNKIGIYDAALISAGSFNWSVPANTRHYENAVFRDEPGIVAQYQAYWDWMWSIAVPIDGSAPSASPRGPPAPGGPALAFKGRSFPSTAFSPRAGSTAVLVSAIGLCERSIDVAMFSFFSSEIGEALVAAHKNGRKVRVVMDRGQARNSPVTKRLKEAGIDVRVSSGIGGAGVLHHKFGIFDAELLETGSFNYSNNAEFNNYENALFSTHPNDLQGFQSEFETLYRQAAPAP